MYRLLSNNFLDLDFYFFIFKTTVMLTQTTALLGIASFVTLVLTVFFGVKTYVNGEQINQKSDNCPYRKATINHFITACTIGVITVGLLVTFIIRALTETHFWTLMGLIVFAIASTRAIIKYDLGAIKGKEAVCVKYGWLSALYIVSCGTCICLLCYGY